jgi:hypothetical protein
MPKSKPVAMFALALAAIAAGTAPALAQPRRATRPLQLFVDVGYVNLFDYPKWMFLGPELEIRVGRIFSLNPEVSIWTSQNLRGGVSVVPGATANVRFNRIVAGVGAISRVSEWAESAGGWLIPKVQVGYFTGPARLSISCLYLSEAKQAAIALTIGMSIGRRPRGPED